MINNYPDIGYIFENSVFMTVFNQIKTGNIVVDSLISTFAIYLIGQIYSKFNKIIEYILDYKFEYFYVKNQITLCGKICISATTYDSVSTKTICSNGFKAINQYLIDNLQINESIKTIRELINTNQEDNIFIIDQTKVITLDKKKQIYLQIEINNDESTDNNNYNKTSYRIENIKFHIFSYFVSLNEINEYIKNITTLYLKNIEKNRETKQFVYKMIKIPPGNHDDYGRFDCWMETTFETTRTFNNIFFNNKKEILNKIDFFLHNKSWYSKMGIPYTLGIGLHGPPGTGKTSFIKALAQHTNRHIIVLSLKLLKKKHQLEEYFFESQYNYLNKKNTITFDKKIIVIEDIDCCDEIVLDRTNEIKKNTSNIEINSESFIYNTSNSSNKKSEIKLDNEPNVTLDDLLNIIDGIQETPGRIIVISSNYYEKLDKALIRPGRIDINLEMKNANHDIIKNMYKYYFNENIDVTTLKQIPEYKYSPAELVNNYIQCNNNKQIFVNNITNFNNNIKRNKIINI